MNATTELLVCTMEECGELIQACSKVIRIANDKQLDKKKLQMAIYELRKESADVRCLLDIMVEKEIVNREELPKMIVEKRKKLRKWSPQILK